MLVNEKKAHHSPKKLVSSWLGPHLGLPGSGFLPKIEDTGDLELAPKGWAQKVKAVDPRATDVSLGMKTAGVFGWALASDGCNPGRAAGGYVGVVSLNLFGAGYGTELGRW